MHLNNLLCAKNYPFSYCCLHGQPYLPLLVTSEVHDPKGMHRESQTPLIGHIVFLTLFKFICQFVIFTI